MASSGALHCVDRRYPLRESALDIASAGALHCDEGALHCDETHKSVDSSREISRK